MANPEAALSSRVTNAKFPQTFVLIDLSPGHIMRPSMFSGSSNVRTRLIDVADGGE